MSHLFNDVGRQPVIGALLLAAVGLIGSQASARESTPVSERVSFKVVLRPEADGDHRVNAITVTEEINLDGATRPLSFSTPLSFAGLVPITARLSQLTVTDDKGSVGITASDARLADDEDGRRWTTLRSVGGKVFVRYRMALEPVAKNGPPYGVKPAGLGIAGSTSTLLVIPEGLNFTKSTLAWDLSQLPPRAVGVATGGAGSITIDGAPTRLLDRWLLAGPAALGQTAEGPQFNAYTVGTPPFEPKAMMSWSRSAYTVLADAFGYLGKPHYELLIRALDGPSFATGTAAVSGGGSLIATGNSYLPSQDDHSVKSIIFHEMGHQWVGQFDGGGSLWFAEGLNVYVTTTLLCEAGLEPWPVCGRLVSSWAKDYYASEGRTWSQAKIEASPFEREDIRRVSYGRGMLYFANLDATLRAKSEGKAGLLAKLRPIFAARAVGRPITPAVWEGFLRNELGETAVDVFRRDVLQGNLIEPLPGAFGLNLERKAVEFTVNGVVQSGYAWTGR